MARYPVYDSHGSLVGNYEWGDIPRLFKDRWYLEKGTFYLNPSTPADSVIPTQRNEAADVSQEPQPARKATRTAKKGKPGRQTTYVWEAPGNERSRPGGPSAKNGSSRVKVVTADGAVLGTVKRRSVEKRLDDWRGGFCSFDGRTVLLSSDVIVGPQEVNELMIALDRAYKSFVSGGEQEPSGVAGAPVKPMMQVFTAGGAFLGWVRRTAIDRRREKWGRGFCVLDGDRILLSPGVNVPKGKSDRLLGSLDRAYSSFVSGTDPRTLARLQAAERARERREGIIELHLEGRSAGCRTYVRSMMLPEESSEVPELVDRERKAHPELYGDVQSFEHIRLATIALANSYDRENSEEVTDLLERAHLFVFDDEAWWESRGCRDELTHLPYPVCLVEDVLVWDVGHGIKSAALSTGANVDASKCMLSYVVNRCVSRKRNDGTVAYAKTREALPGAIAVSSLRGTRAPSTQRRSTTGASQGRSPRRHTRRGHWRNQAYGPGMKLHKRIWISDTIVGPSGKSYRITEPTRVHLVTLSDAGGQ